jgi:hypothetical protein
MKKLTAIFCMIFISCLFIGKVSADAVVGIILDGQKGSCTVKKKNGATMKCRAGMHLHIGDEITKTQDVKKIQILWLTSSLVKAVETSKTSVRITMVPPSDKTLIAEYARETIPFLQKLPLVRQLDGSCGQSLIPRPGYSVTLLPEENTIFSWLGNGNTFIITDRTKYQVVRIPLSNETSLMFTPERIGMQPGQKYSWYVEGIETDEFYDIRLLSTEYTTLVRKGFAAIENSIQDTEKQAVVKAAYVQLLSDLYPKDVDLYWLSAQLIQNVHHDATSGLLMRFAQHLQRTAQFH